MRFIHIVFGFLICLSFCTSLSAKDDLIPRKLLFGNPEKAKPEISPDGKKLAYLAPNEQGVLNIWVKNLEQPESDTQVTFDNNRGVHAYFWDLDNEHLFYMQDLDGDENLHLFQTDILQKTTKELTPYPGVKVGILAHDYKFPEEILIKMNKRNREVFDIYRLNLKTGTLDLDTENTGNYFSWVADHNLQVRVAQSYDKDGSTLIHTRENSTQPWKTFLKVDPLDNAYVIGFTPSNEAIYVLTDLDANTDQLLEINLKNSKHKLIAQDPDNDINTVLTNPTTHALEAIGVEKERFEWIMVDPALQKDFQFLANELKTIFSITSEDKANENWIVASKSDTRPIKYYLYQRSNKKLTFLFSTQPELENYTMSPVTPITFSARDGMKIHGYLTLPVGIPPENLPTVLYVHGGPWVRDYWQFNPYVQWFVNRGYAVLQINYRGSTGYGKKYLNAGNREWAGKMQTDLLDGKAWLVKKGYTDPNKVAIYGGSYGGYATLVGLTFTPNEFCCGVDIVGPSNLITLLKSFPAYWTPFLAQNDIRLGNVEKDEEDLKSRSPLFKAEFITKPLLIGQGANDPRVKQAESDQIVEAMRRKNIPIEYILFPDEGHGFAKPENRLKFNTAAESFLAKHLGGKLEPVSASENWDHFKK